MDEPIRRFPDGFLWGAATSSHQVEGNNRNNQWWEWEQQPGHIYAGHTSGLACNWWAPGGAEADFDRAHALHQNAHRLSLEWSRLEPVEGIFDGSAYARYRQMLQGLRARGIEPMVTLHHFTDPLWLTDQGGWLSPHAVERFRRYVERTVDELGDLVQFWCTINEPNVYALSGYVTGDFPPGVQDLKRAVQVEASLLRGHSAAYLAIHRLQPEARVGYALHYRPMTAKHAWSPLDRLMRRMRHEGVNMAFPSAISSGVLRSPVGRVAIPEAQGKQDFLGLNYYSTDTVSFNLANHREMFTHSSYPEGADLSTNRLIASIPEGLFDSLDWAVRTYPNLPILITENGTEDLDDHMRPRYLAQHVHQMWRGVNFNWPVKGYFHWSLVDNFEWERGWTQRFGLWSLDVETQKRIKRPSADLYAAICKENGLSSEMVQKYCPEVFEKIFPA